MRTDPALSGALARLQSRWGSAAVRLGNGAHAGTLGTASADREDDHERVVPLTEGALAPVLRPLPRLRERDAASSLDEVVSTGFPVLDALLGTGGLPREASAVLRGDASSGKTTLALRCMAEAQRAGAIVAYLDLGRAFDPLEAVARGVDLRWLLVVRPHDAREGLALAGALLAGRTVDLLVVDLPSRLAAAHEPLMRRLIAHARRTGSGLICLEPAGLAGQVAAALAEGTGLRLELDRHGWIRVGRDVVGQRTVVRVAKNRFGPPGREAVLEIVYADDGERGGGVQRRLMSQPLETGPPRSGLTDLRPVPSRRLAHATPPPRLASSPAPP